MDPVSVLVAPLAKAILSQAGKELGGAAARGARARVLGDPERKALEQALGRAFAEVEKTYSRRLAEFDINLGFWEHEGAVELSKVLIPGVEASAVRLAEKAVDSLGRARSDDERFDRVSVLRPVFKALLDALAGEVRRESALHAVLVRADAAQTARAATRVAEAMGAGAATEDDRVGYLGWMVDQHRYLRTAGVVRNITVQLPLDEVFVGLRALPDRHPGDRARTWFEQERKKLAALVEAGRLDQTGFEAELDRLQAQYGRKFAVDDERAMEQPEPALNAIRDAAQVLVLGDPGTGKTTLLRYLAISHARALLAGTSVLERSARLPIFVRIGEYARQGYPTMGISEFLPGYLGRAECRLPGLADLLGRQLDAGRCLVLLDGLDEIGSAELRRGVVAAVVNFVTAYARQGNRFVVTSRIAGYQAAPLPEPFTAVRLQDMDDETITRFLEVYCRQVERAETPDKSDAAIIDAGAREATAIGQALQTNAGVRRLAANPLLLTALVLVHRASGRLPHRRVEAYVEVCNALGRTWRSAQGVADADLPDERILTRWLTELGAWMHQYRPEGAATRRELLEVLGPLWAAHQGEVWDPGVLTAADPLGTNAGRGVIDFVDKADTHTGLLVERAPGRYGFAHLTFEEYYAGRALAFRGSAIDRVTALRSRLHDPRYTEPILLALGLIGTDYADQIDDVVAEAIYPAAEPSPHEDLLGRDFLFVLRVAADDVPLQTTTIDTIIDQAIDEWLAPEISRCRFTSYRQALMQQFAAFGGTKAAERFRTVLDKRASTLAPDTLGPWIELAGIAARLGPSSTVTPTARSNPLPPSTVNTLVLIATGDAADPGMRVQAASVLASGGALSQPVTDALVQLATGDADPFVRVQAVSVLASGGALSQPVIDALVQVATGDAARFVRVQAVSVLASDGALSQPVTDALVQVATGDAEPQVRVQAASVLASGGALSQPVTDALVQLATGDADPYVRMQTGSVLASGGALSQPVTDALVQLATGDADPFVRVQAGSVLASGGALSQPVTDALVQLATGAANPDVRVEAVSVLASGGALSQPVTDALVQVATGDADPFVRMQTGSVLASDGALSQPVIDALVQVATGDADRFVRVEAVSALASGGALSQPVTDALVQLATGNADPDVRVQAGSALASSGALSQPVTDALVQLATGAANPGVRVQAGSVLASGGALSQPVTDALVQLATGAANPGVRVQAGSVLASGGALSQPVTDALVQLATGAANPGVRVQAGSVLASGGALSQPVTDALVQLATSGEQWATRQDAVHALQDAQPTDDLRRILVSLFRDSDNDVRRQAGRVLVELSRRHPERSADIRLELAAACEEPSLREKDGIESRTGWDYAYEALQTHVELVTADQ